MISDDLCFAPAVELAGLIRSRSVSVVEVIDTFLDRIDRINPRLNAYVTVTAEAARDAARQADRTLQAGNAPGPLHGVPVAIKDLIYTAQIRTTAGSLIYRDFVPEQDAIVVARLKAAGAIIIGKTNTPEFGFKSTTENLVCGVTRNPWDLDKTAGGSSGGAGAATAAGIAPLSIGTDGGGSIRTPSSFCGIYGLKPTFGRVPSGPGFGGGRTISHTGPMTRTVADAAALMDIIAKPHERDRHSIPASDVSFSTAITQDPGPLRVGWSPDLGYAPVDPQVAAVTREAMAGFGEIGWPVDESDPEFSDPNEFFNTIIRAENYVATKELLRAHSDQLDPGLREFTENGANISAFDYLSANQLRDDLYSSIARYFENHDLLVTPTLAVPPFAIGTRPDKIASRDIHGMSWVAFTYPFNLSGNPAASVPCGFTRDGLPIGLQIVGARGADALVLQASAAFERARPWAQHRPTVPGA